MENLEEKAQFRGAMVALLAAERWGALATSDSNALPEASMVAYVWEEGSRSIYLHLSRLAAHTSNLLRRPQAALVVGEADDRRADPQTLARLSLSGAVELLERSSPAYDRARALYLARLPEAERLFAFGDFQLFRLEVERLRFVAGFGRAFSYRPEALLG